MPLLRSLPVAWTIAALAVLGAPAFAAEKADAAGFAKVAQPYKVQLLPGSVEQMWKDFTAYRFGGRR